MGAEVTPRVGGRRKGIKLTKLTFATGLVANISEIRDFAERPFGCGNSPGSDYPLRSMLFFARSLEMQSRFPESCPFVRREGFAETARKSRPVWVVQFI